MRHVHGHAEVAQRVYAEVAQQGCAEKYANLNILDY
jgi:hypothetical protein